MKLKSLKKFDGHSWYISVQSSTVHLNCLNAANDEIAIAIEFLGVEDLSNAVFTFNKEDIDVLFFSKVRVPINERCFFGGQIPGNDDYQFQFPKARITLAPYHASVFCDVVDEFYDTWKHIQENIKPQSQNDILLNRENDKNNLNNNEVSHPQYEQNKIDILISWIDDFTYPIREWAWNHTLLVFTLGMILGLLIHKLF
jgi:hypothetical protein